MIGATARCPDGRRLLTALTVVLADLTEHALKGCNNVPVLAPLHRHEYDAYTCQ